MLRMQDQALASRQATSATPTESKVNTSPTLAIVWLRFPTAQSDLRRPETVDSRSRRRLRLFPSIQRRSYG